VIALNKMIKIMLTPMAFFISIFSAMKDKHNGLRADYSEMAYIPKLGYQ
jgi:hypothetical protein